MVYKATKNLNLSRNNKAIFSDKCSTYCFLIVNAEVLRQNCFPRPSARPTLRLSHVNSIPLSLGRSMVILFYKQKRLTNFALILHFYMEVVGTRFFSLSRYHYFFAYGWHSQFQVLIMSTKWRRLQISNFRVWLHFPTTLRPE